MGLLHCNETGRCEACYLVDTWRDAARSIGLARGGVVQAHEESVARNSVKD